LTWIPPDDEHGPRLACDQCGCGATVDPWSPGRRLWRDEFHAVKGATAHYCPQHAGVPDRG